MKYFLNIVRNRSNTFAFTKFIYIQQAVYRNSKKLFPLAKTSENLCKAFGLQTKDLYKTAISQSS